MAHRGRVFVLAACVTVASAGGAARASQDWRRSALASFDDVWQTVHDTFYDPTFGGLDWSAVRSELRPKAEAAATPDDVRRVIREMLARLKRSHFALISTAAGGDEPAMTGNAIVPVDIRVVTGEMAKREPGSYLLVTRVDPGAAGAEVHAGDIVTAIDGTAVSRFVAAAAAISDERARRLEVWRLATRALHGPDGSVAALDVLRGAEPPRAIRVPRAVELGEVVTLGNLPPLHVRVTAAERATPAHRRVGVIGFNIWMAAVDAPFAAAVDRFRRADGLVIDLRGNPGGLAGMMRGIAGHIFADEVTLGTSQMRDTSLQFAANPRRSTPDGRRVEPFVGPVAILVDELTGSASECFAAAVQSLGRARVFGRVSMGQALPASTKRLENGDVLLYALGDFVTSTGRRVEGEGVIPDTVVPVDIEALATGRDPVVDAALSWVDRARSGRGGRP